MRTKRGDYEKFFRGEGIDIGSNIDILKSPYGTARGWDLQDGDAQLMASVPDEKFDFVYSSHCLEHMRDVPESIRNWQRILKRSGWLYIVVPDYILYEKMTFPSRFNPDHKQSFSDRISRLQVGRPNHWHMDQDLVPLLRELGLTEISWGLEHEKFDFNAGIYDQTMGDAMAQLCCTARKV
jgi:SAM-dependent methyltransferase